MSAQLPSFLLLLALFVHAVIHGLDEGLTLPHAALLDILGRLFFVISMWSWFEAYSRRHGIRWPMDMALFLAIAWPLLVPYYVFRTEGRRGWGLLGIYAVTMLAAWAVGSAISIWLRVWSASR